MCPRAVRLLGVMPPEFASCFFVQVMPDFARAKPQRENSAYWLEVECVGFSRAKTNAPKDASSAPFRAT